jgi:putative FmdB family regulatory protein
MPFYDFKCNECEVPFVKYLKIADRKIPETEPCPNCSKVAVSQVVGSPAVYEAVRSASPPKEFTKVLEHMHKNIYKSDFSVR